MSAPHLGIDNEDFGFDILPAIEKSFGVRFEQTDFKEMMTYGEFCTLIQSKLPPANSSDCTSQQAFYKLRLVLQTPAIGPTSSLAAILPSQRAPRRQAAKAIEQALGMKLNIVDMPSLAESFCISLLLLSLFGLPMAAVVGHITGSAMGWWGCLAAFTIAIIGMNAGTRLGTTLQYATVGELVEAMCTRFYRQSRRDPSKVNKLELARQLNALFSYCSGIELAELTPDAVLK